MTSRRAVVQPADLSDEELMGRVQADDVDAFAELYDRYSARAFGLARMVCGDSQLAEEAAQDGFLAVWRGRANFDPGRGSTGAWLMTLIRHRSIDLIRRSRPIDRRRASDGELGHLRARDDVAGEVEQSDDASRLRAALEQLPEPQREVIILAYFSGLTHTEIAEHLHLPLGTVKGRMRLGLHRLSSESQPILTSR